MSQTGDRGKSNFTIRLNKTGDLVLACVYLGFAIPAWLIIYFSADAGLVEWYSIIFGICTYYGLSLVYAFVRVKEISLSEKGIIFYPIDYQIPYKQIEKIEFEKPRGVFKPRARRLRLKMSESTFKLLPTIFFWFGHTATLRVTKPDFEELANQRLNQKVN